MIKKFLHIVLSIFLLVTTAGVTLTMHYCGGKLVSTNFSQNSNTCCNTKGCCENKTVHFEIKDNYTVPAINENPSITEIDLIVHAFFLNELSKRNLFIIGEHTYNDTSPPLISESLLLFTQTFRC